MPAAEFDVRPVRENRVRRPSKKATAEKRMKHGENTSGKRFMSNDYQHYSPITNLIFI